MILIFWVGRYFIMKFIFCDVILFCLWILVCMYRYCGNGVFSLIDLWVLRLLWFYFEDVVIFFIRGLILKLKLVENFF